MNIFDDLKDIKIQSQQEQINSPRFGLSLLVGKIIRCEALLTPNKSKAKVDGVECNLNTIINIHHKGKLVADHIQLNLEKIYAGSNWKINEDVTMKIEFKGIVYSYNTGDTEKYSVELIEKTTI